MNQKRGKQGKVGTRSRFVALLSGATALVRWGNIMKIRLSTESGEHLFRSRFVFICNNPEELHYFNLPAPSICIDADKSVAGAFRNRAVEDTSITRW